MHFIDYGFSSVLGSSSRKIVSNTKAPISLMGLNSTDSFCASSETNLRLLFTRLKNTRIAPKITATFSAPNAAPAILFKSPNNAILATLVSNFPAK